MVRAKHFLTLVLIISLCCSFYACKSEGSQPGQDDPLFGTEAMENVTHISVFAPSVSDSIQAYVEENQLSEDSEGYTQDCLDFRDERKDALLQELRAFGFYAVDTPEWDTDEIIWGTGSYLTIHYADSNNEGIVEAMQDNYVCLKIMDERGVCVRKQYYKTDAVEAIYDALDAVFEKAAWPEKK